MEKINYILTEEQARDICAYFHKDYEKMEDYEICELLDELIDMTVTGF